MSFSGSNRQKKVKVTFILEGGEEWVLHVPAKNAMIAIAEAYKYFVREGRSVEDVVDIKTEKSDSYL